ncbi:MAG: hypothetical protein D8M28_08840 [Proteobacteria bacterium]|nr:hypothetical protein [Pseudomonadota bacterium]
MAKKHLDSFWGEIHAAVQKTRKSCITKIIFFLLSGYGTGILFLLQSDAVFCFREFSASIFRRFEK